MSVEEIFSYLQRFDNALWNFVGFPAIILFGFYLSYKANFIHLRKLPYVFKSFFKLLTVRKSESGVHPLKAFFASVGGCFGIGNMVAICTAVQVGGPGALFWVWIAAIAGMILKYSEIYLGMRYRVPNDRGGHNGGPMFFLQKVFKSSVVPKIAALLLCVYGVEIYQFSVMTKSIAYNFEIDSLLVSVITLTLIVIVASGGVKRVGRISSVVIPVFILLYLSMGFWVLWQNIGLLPGVLKTILTSAFTGHAAIGGFAGSSFMMAISYGIRRGCYSGDIGIGYASVIHSESCLKTPEKQALLAIFDVFLDTFVISTTSILLILVTGTWQQPLPEIVLVQHALQQYFPYTNYFMPVVLYFLGYTTIIAYFCVGLKCAKHIHRTWGKPVYFTYAVVSMLLFSFVESREALLIMSITGALLLMINLYGIFRMRHEISFDFHEEEKEVPATVPVDLLEQDDSSLVIP